MDAWLLAALLTSAAPGPVSAGPPAWLELAMPESPAQARQAWRELRSTGVLPPAPTDGPEVRPLAFSVPQGRWKGEWTFFFEGSAEEPLEAWRLSLPASPPYRVHASLYCARSRCALLAGRLQALPAPVVRGQLELYLEWSAIVRAEPCDASLPPRTPYPRYPGRAIASDIEGSAKVQLFHNACGDVRDVSLRESSGDRELDRAALSTLRGWRIVPPRPGKAGIVIQPVTFRLEEDLGSEPAPSAP